METSVLLRSEIRLSVILFHTNFWIVQSKGSIHLSKIDSHCAVHANYALANKRRQYRIWKEEHRRTPSIYDSCALSRMTIALSNESIAVEDIIWIWYRRVTWFELEDDSLNKTQSEEMSSRIPSTPSHTCSLMFYLFLHPRQDFSNPIYFAQHRRMTTDCRGSLSFAFTCDNLALARTTNDWLRPDKRDSYMLPLCPNYVALRTCLLLLRLLPCACFPIVNDMIKTLIPTSTSIWQYHPDVVGFGWLHPTKIALLYF